VEEAIVIIKPLAYLKMLKHVLRFGSMAKKKSQFKECMGMLMGKLGALKGTVKDVTIVDVVEMTHGGHIEVAFEDRDYVAFAEINERYAKEGVFNVGWYHSHPGLTTFLSTVDVRNHLGFQTTNPSAIAIVWDHILLEEANHNGFECFRLTELGKGQYSDYKAVKYVVEPPTTLDFYKLAIKDVLDMQQGGNPPTFEVNELPNVLGDYDPIPVDDAKFIPVSYKSSANSTPITVGNGKISPKIMQPLADYLNNWSKDLAQGLKNKGVVVNQNLMKLKESIEKGVKDLQVWFLNEAYEELSKLQSKVDEALEKPLEAKKPAMEAILQMYPVDASKQGLFDKPIPDILNQLKASRQAYDAAIKSKFGGK
jgi:proteasome lid subunit RPN8/RPN11